MKTRISVFLACFLMIFSVAVLSACGNDMDEQMYPEIRKMLLYLKTLKKYLTMGLPESMIRINGFSELSLISSPFMTGMITKWQATVWIM